MPPIDQDASTIIIGSITQQRDHKQPVHSVLFDLGVTIVDSITFEAAATFEPLAFWGCRWICVRSFVLFLYEKVCPVLSFYPAKPIRDRNIFLIREVASPEKERET